MNLRKDKTVPAKLLLQLNRQKQNKKQNQFALFRKTLEQAVCF